MQECCTRLQQVLYSIYYVLWVEPLGHPGRSPYGMSVDTEDEYETVGYSERSHLLRNQHRDRKLSRRGSRESSRSRRNSQGIDVQQNGNQRRRRTLEARHTMSFIPNEDDIQLPLEFRRKYELGGLVGVGTSSKCFLSTRRSDGKEFACKVIDTRKLALTHPAGIVKQFKSEIHTLEYLDHPNIISLEDHYDTNDKILIVMELLRGGELFDKIVAENGLCESEAKTIFVSVCDAIRYMHSVNVIHRDVKPENMLLVSNKSSEVKIIDFGFSKVMNGGAYARSFMGTGGFLAPELRYSDAYTKAVDMWSLGVTLYVMLSGYLPFDAGIDPKPESQYKLRFPSKQWDHISPAAKDLVSHLLVVNPDARYSAEQVMRHDWVLDIRSPNAYQYVPRSNSVSSPTFAIQRDGASLSTRGDETGSTTPNPASVYPSSDDDNGDDDEYHNKVSDTSRRNNVSSNSGAEIVTTNDITKEYRRNDTAAAIPVKLSSGAESHDLSPSNSVSTNTTSDETIHSGVHEKPFLCHQEAPHRTEDMSGETCEPIDARNSDGNHSKTQKHSKQWSNRKNSDEHIPTPYLGPVRHQTGLLLSRDKAILKRSCSLPNVHLMHAATDDSTLHDDSNGSTTQSKSVHGGNLFFSLGLNNEFGTAQLKDSHTKENSKHTIPQLIL